MLFNSDDFLRFFALFFPAYCLLRGHLFLRNLLIVVASYVFYSWWDARITILLFGTSVLDFTVARLLDSAQSPSKRRALLMGSIAINLAVLGAFTRRLAREPEPFLK